MNGFEGQEKEFVLVDMTQGHRSAETFEGEGVSFLRR